MPRTLAGCTAEGREGEEKLHGRLWKEGEQGRGNPGGYIPKKGWFMSTGR